MTATPLFSSAPAPLLEQYVDVKKSLGRRFATATWTLQSLDRFLRDHAGTHKDLTRESSVAANPRTAIAPFDRLVDQVMTRPPYNDARGVFWIVDNCSAHRCLKAVERLRSRYPRLMLVHAPIPASWLNQVEIYFSIVQRKVLTPNDFDDLNAVAERLLELQHYWTSLRMEVHP